LKAQIIVANLEKAIFINMRKYTNIPLTFLFIYFCCFIHGCSTLEKQTSDQQVQSISFGKTGGFSNINNTYNIERNGKISREAQGDHKVINEIRKKDIRKIEKELSRIGFTSLDLSEVGNITYYIEVNYANSTKKNTWIETTENEEIKEIYILLISYLNP